MAIAALLLVVVSPLLLGVFASLLRFISGFEILLSSSHPPAPYELWSFYLDIATVVWVSLLSSIPAYLTAIIGATVRAVWDRRNEPRELQSASATKQVGD